MGSCAHARAATEYGATANPSIAPRTKWMTLGRKNGRRGPKAEQLRICRARLDGCLRRNSTDAFWDAWSQAVEEGLIGAMQLEDSAKTAYGGHGPAKCKGGRSQRR